MDDFPRDPRRPQRRYPYCKPCKAGYMRDSFKRNQPARRLRERKYRIKKRYGITPERYEELLAAQNGRCAICGSSEPKLNSNAVHYCTFSFQVDHCHKTGMVRGLLCSRCNVGLGSFEDDASLLERAARYLRAASVRGDRPLVRRPGSGSRV